jgi:hypothetical protein
MSKFFIIQISNLVSMCVTRDTHCSLMNQTPPLPDLYDGTRIKKSQSRRLCGSRIIIMIYIHQKDHLQRCLSLCYSPRIMKLVKGMLDLNLLYWSGSNNSIQWQEWLYLFTKTSLSETGSLFLVKNWLRFSLAGPTPRYNSLTFQN